MSKKNLVAFYTNTKDKESGKRFYCNILLGTKEDGKITFFADNSTVFNVDKKYITNNYRYVPETLEFTDAMEEDILLPNEDEVMYESERDDD